MQDHVSSTEPLIMIIHANPKRRHVFLAWGCILLLGLMVACQTPKTTYSEEGPDIMLQQRWNYLCLKAQLVLSRCVQSDTLPYPPLEFFLMLDYRYRMEGTSRASSAFARLFLYSPDRIDYDFFKRYGETAGGFTWDCPAMRCLFPPRTAHTRSIPGKMEASK